VRFMLGKADLQTDSTWYGTDTLFISQMYKNLDSLAYALILDTGFFEIQYHADCRYNNNSSSNLTGRRALAICLYLVQKGVKLEKLVPKGYAANLPRILTEGETKTLLTCNYVNKFKEADLAKYEFLQGLNRRVVIKRLSN
jgi:outer membrane protein OmpA-like peptidoglycan-associated protein